MTASSSKGRSAGIPAPQPPDALTDEQRQALETWHASIALSAGAGCGKTFVLTRRFLAGLERGVPLSRVVAMTFTERAAREMRERVRAVCRQQLRDAPQAEEPRWRALVRDIDGARIGTIHSFCAALLRAHAVEARVDPLSRVLDELTAAALRARAAEQTLHALLKRDDPDAVELVCEQGLERAAELIESMLEHRPGYDFDRWLALSAGELATTWLDFWWNRYLPKLIEEFLASECVDRVQTLLSRHSPGHPVMQERAKALHAAFKRPPPADRFAAFLAELRELAVVKGGGGAEAWESDDVYVQVREALEALRNASDSLQAMLEVKSEDLQANAAHSLAFGRVVWRARQACQQLKRELAVLDFDDLLLMTRDLLRQSPGALQQAAGGIDLLLVDEFQDTDPVQAEVVRLLCGDEFASGKLFLVGDSKQSIYRFRGAEPGVFRAIRAELPEAGRLGLTLNFRSQPAILNFVNVLCDGALEGPYEPLRACHRQLAPEPCVEFLFAGSDSATDKHDAGWTAESRRALEAEWVARRVAQLLEDPLPRVRCRDEVTGQQALRRVEARDVVLLFRAMTSVRLYEEALREAGLDCYVVGGSAFYAQQEIFDMANLLSCIDDVDDEVALVGVLRSPLFSCSDDALLALAAPPAPGRQSPTRCPLWNALLEPPPAHLADPDRQQLRFAASVLAELRRRKDRLSISELLELAVERTGYDAALLTEFMGPRKLANLRKLQDMARDFDRVESLTLKEFITRLRSAMFKEAVEPLAAMHPESGNVIRLISIHQAKGLEFPVVFVADTDRVMISRRDIAGLDPELGPCLALPARFGRKRDHLGLRMAALRDQADDLKESMRLLYVACTRAADLLILSAALHDPGKPEGPWTRLLASRFDLRTGQPRQEPLKGANAPMARYAGCLPEIRVHHQAPAMPAKSSARRRRRIPPGALRERVEAAVPAPLPSLVRAIPPTAPQTLRLSVSALEVLANQALAESGETPSVLCRAVSGRLVSAGLAESSAGAGPNEGVDPISLGHAVHLVLERCDPRRFESALALVDDLPFAVEAAAAEALRAGVRRCVRAWFAAPARALVATAARLYREIEFLLPWPIAPAAAAGGRPAMPPQTSVVISGTLDCLLLAPHGGWHVIDYKTGQLGSDRASDLVRDSIEHYAVQLVLYARAVAGMVETPPERLSLVCLPSGAQVDLQVDAAGLAAVSQLVDRAIDQALRAALGAKPA